MEFLGGEALDDCHMDFGGPTLQPSSNNLLNLPKHPPSRDDVTFFLGFSLCKSEIKENF
jgi:hypothetical protein